MRRQKKQTPEQEAIVRAIDCCIDEGKQLAYSMSQPKKKWLSQRQEFDAYDGPESDLQQQLDDLLLVYNIWFIRIADGFFRWVVMNAPARVRMWFCGMFAGIPDNLPMIRISDKYMLCCPIELKNKKGQLRGKQKHWEGMGIPVQLSRSPDTSIVIIEQFRRDAEKVRKLLIYGNH